MSTVLISGGSGVIGNELKMFLKTNGYNINILSRQPTQKEKNIHNWNLNTQYIDKEAFENVSVVINLAGSPIIGNRWTTKNKEKHRNSRILSTRLLVNTINQKQLPIKHFIQASAMGYYGHSGDKPITESSENGKDFMASLCEDWENEAKKLNNNVELSILRIGLYLSKSGGVHKKISDLSKFYLASGFGSGKQYVNYSHRDEFNLLVLRIINQGIKAGTYNAVGKQACTLNDFVKEVIYNSKSKMLLPNIPAFALKLILGEASSALLNSYNVTSEKLNNDFFLYSNIKEAIENL